MVESAKVFAQQAKAAGVTVNVKVLDGGTFYGDQYLKWTFSSDFWGTRSYLAQVAAGSAPVVAVQRDALAARRLEVRRRSTRRRWPRPTRPPAARSSAR